jgi:hypothetical protein
MGTVIRYWEEQIPKVLPQILSEESSTKKMPLGYIHKEANGDEWIYCKMGAVAGVVGKVYQTELAVVSDYTDLPVDTIAAGANEFTTVDLGATGNPAVNEFAEGTLHVNDDTGEGQLFRIYSNTAPAAAGGTITVVIYGVVTTSLGADSTVTLLRNDGYNVIVQPSPPTNKVVCVPQRPVTADYYFWGKKKGRSCVLADGVLVIAKHCVASDAVDGAVEDKATNITQVIGVVLAINATGEYAVVDLDL